MDTERKDSTAADESIGAPPRSTHASWTADFDRDGVAALLETAPKHVPVDVKAGNVLEI